MARLGRGHAQSDAGARTAPEPVELVAAVYESALSTQPFGDVLPQLAAALGGDAALIALWAPELDAGELAVTHAMPHALVEGYRDGLWKSDAWRLAILRKNVPVGRAINGRALVPFPELQRTDMYDGVLRPYGYFDTCCGRIYAKESAGAAISLLRGRGRPFFGRSEVARLGDILPHMTRAFALHRQFSTLIAERAALAEVLDRTQGGAILCDRQGRIVHASEAARRVLAAGTRLFASRSRLRLRDPRADGELARIFRRGADALGQGFAAHSLTVRAPDGGADLQLTILRKIPGRLLDSGTPDIFFYVLLHAANAPPDAVVSVARRHALTPAETRLAERLAAGVPLGEAADLLGVSINTVRSQLQQIFQKTGVSRQAALVRLLLSQR